MSDQLASDVIVVGNGVLGLSIAVELARNDQTLKITVIGDQHLTGAASKAAGAMLGSFGELTSTSTSSEAGVNKFKMSLQATDLWPDWLSYLSAGSAAGTHIKNGTFVFTNCRSGSLEDENFLAIQEALDHHQEPYEVVKPNEVDFLLPEEDSRATNLIYIPGEGSVDGAIHLANLNAMIASSENINFIGGWVTNIELSNASATGVRLLSGQVLTAKSTIIANGVGAGALLQSVEALSGTFPPVFAGMGTSMVVSQPKKKIDSVIRTPNRAFACGFHAVPRHGEQLYLGATNNIHLNVVEHPSISDMHFLMECAMEQLNHTMHEGNVFSICVGNRPISLDTYPLLGATRIEGLIVATGTYRDGFHLSPLVARLISALVIDGYEAPELQYFGVHRPHIQSFGLNEAVEQTIKYYSAVGYEHGLKIPKVGWHEMFDEYFREKAISLYAELDSDIVLHPDLFSIIDQDRKAMVPLFREYLRTAATRCMEA